MTPEEIEAALQIELAAMNEITKLSFQATRRMCLVAQQVAVARVLIGVGVFTNALYFLIDRRGWLLVVSATSSIMAILMIVHANIIASRQVKQLQRLSEEALQRALRAKQLAQGKP